MMKITALSFFFLLVTLLGLVAAQEPLADGRALRNPRGFNGELKRRLSKGGKGDDDDDGKGKGGKGKGDDDDDSGKGGKGGKGDDDDDSGKGGKGGKGDDDDDGKGGGKGVSRRHLQKMLV